jgi:uncharacterized protein YdaT
MPWTEQHYPPSMRHLPPAVRSKAIAIANALLAESCDEGKTIRIAIARARSWWARRPGGVRQPRYVEWQSQVHRADAIGLPLRSKAKAGN